MVLSDEMLEHVQNHLEFIIENHQISKPGGISLYIFPGRWTPIEIHTYVPLASIHRCSPLVTPMGGTWYTQQVSRKFTLPSCL